MKAIVSRCAVVPAENVDTDQIIPARFLKGTARTGLGVHCFADWPVKPAGGAILVAGANFGCGSSREHAVWALIEAGFRAVVSTRIADIFHANALRNGLVPVVVPPEVHGRLGQGVQASIDVETQTLAAAGLRAPFPLDRFARYRLLHDLDELGFVLAQSALIDDYEERRRER